MIALVRGEVAIRRSDHVVLLCSGVGYRMAVSSETLRHVPAVGGETTLHTHLVVRDDALLLHGFHSEQERDLFLMLLKRLATRAAVRDRGRRRRTLSGGARDRQAHSRAHHR